MFQKPTLSLCMIVKNEENHIVSCLESVQDLVDEIILVDTGSTDTTLDMAAPFSTKVYYYPWDNSFSNARNFSLEKATGKWILLLDADERIEKADIPILREFIQRTRKDGAHFTVYNYIGKGENYTLHQAFRLLRNNGLYHFVGDIHEQISRKDGRKIENVFDSLTVRLHHVGYLDAVAQEKDKRNRNIPLLLKELEKKPDNGFTLFNLGNEYMALKDYDKALAYYEEAYQHMNPQEAYTPHLIFRRAMCLYHQKVYKKALFVLNEGLKLYPLCTDYVYLKGLIYQDRHRITLALEHFQKAIDAENPPLSLQFIEGCNTYRPLCSMGDLYLSQHDDVKALDSYTRAINIDNRQVHALYKIGRTLSNLYADKNHVAEALSKYFSGQSHLPNLILQTDILLNLHLYPQSEKILVEMKKFEDYPADKAYLHAKQSLFTQHADEAYLHLQSLFTKEKAASILPNLYEESAILLFACALILKKDMGFALQQIKTHGLEKTATLFPYIYQIISNENHEEPCPLMPDAALPLFQKFLGLLLQAQAAELFEKALVVYNTIDSKQVLLSLAQVYADNGYPLLAAKQVLRSMKEFGVINHDGVCILQEVF